MMKSFECTVELYETCMYLLNIYWSTVYNLFNYFYTKTRCQETLFSFILKTLSSSLFASMFCQSILLMSASPLLLFSTAGMMHDPDYIPYKKEREIHRKIFPFGLLCFAPQILLFFLSILRWIEFLKYRGVECCSHFYFFYFTLPLEIYHAQCGVLSEYKISVRFQSGSGKRTTRFLINDSLGLDPVC